MSNPGQEPYTQDFAPEIPSPRRVVSLVPSLTESLFDLGLGERIVGLTTQCRYPADRLAHLPRLGETRNPDIAQVIALRPDLVMMSREANRDEDAFRFTDAGIPVWVTHPRTVSEAINLLWELMLLFAEPAATERVRWIERQMDWTAASAAQHTPMRVFAPVGYAPWRTATTATYTHDLLRVCGGKCVPVVDVKSHDPISPVADVMRDQILAAQPEVILLQENSPDLDREHATALGAMDIPAAKNQRIHIVDGSLLTWPGTRMARAFTEIAPLLAAPSPVA